MHAGNQTLDSICQVLLSIGMFMGGLIGLILDCTIPGTYQERGMSELIKMREQLAKAEASPTLMRQIARVYDWPCGMKFLRRWKFSSYVPFLPTYGMAQTSNHISSAGGDHNAVSPSDVSNCV